jgi:zinc D-Ala-D-Ala carboxypeptidase
VTAKPVWVADNFTEAEFLVSQTAARAGREIVLPDELRPNLVLLATTILQPLSDHLKRSIAVISGYRPGWLNKAVGGSKSSEHVQAIAADITVQGMTVTEVCNTIIGLKLPFGELIHEFGSWTHVSASLTARPRREIWTARKQPNGKTVYLSGIRG